LVELAKEFDMFLDYRRISELQRKFRRPARFTDSHLILATTPVGEIS